MLLKGKPALFQDIEILVLENSWTRIENVLFQWFEVIVGTTRL
jgi:hypothetical protein